MKEGNDVLRHLEIGLEDHSNGSLQKKFKSIINRGIEKWGQNNKSRAGNYSSVVVDIGQHKQSVPDIDWFDAEDLDNYLRPAGRNIEDAKKRFQYVQSAYLPYSLAE